MPTSGKTDRKGRIGSIAFILLFSLAGLSAGYFGAKYLKASLLLQTIGPEGPGEKILYLAMTFFAIWLTIALHELGHLTAGLAQGFRLALYTAGALGIRGTERGARLFFNSDINLVGGLAATYPEKTESGPALRRKFARILVAGPFASLVVAVAALSAGWLLAQQIQTPAPLILRAGATFLYVLGTMSALIFLVTGLPLPSRGFMTDGARYLLLQSGGEKGLLEEAGLAVTALMGAGKLPGAYPSELLERLTSVPAGSLLGLNGHFLAFTHHLDREETDQALAFAQTIEANLDAVPAGMFRRYYLKEIVFFYAFLAGDIEKARALWEPIASAAEKDRDAASFRAKAALALLEGRRDEAASLVEAGLKKIADLPFAGQRRYEKKWLHAILKQSSTPHKPS